MPLKVVFSSPKSGLNEKNPITKALLPPSRVSGNFCSSPILGPSRRANTKTSSLISEESGFSPLIRENFGLVPH